MALRGACIENVKFKIIKTRTGQLKDILLQPKPFFFTYIITLYNTDLPYEK